MADRVGLPLARPSTPLIALRQNEDLDILTPSPHASPTSAIGAGEETEKCDGPAFYDAQYWHCCPH